MSQKSTDQDLIREKQRLDLEDKQKGIQSESSWNQVKESVKGTAKAAFNQAQFSYVQGKEKMLGSDKPAIRKEDIPTNLEYQGEETCESKNAPKEFKGKCG